MLKTYKYRIYPTIEQSDMINKHIGSCRFIYNLALECKKMAYCGNKVNLTSYDLIKQLPDLKKEYNWLNEVNSQSLQQSIIHLDNAFTRFFKGQSNFPNFKKKIDNQSFNIPQNIIFDFENGKLILPKFNKKGINITVHRKFKGDIKNATISKSPTGKYFASILVDTGIATPIKKYIKEKTTTGIDLGIKSFLVTSEGLEINNPKLLQNSLSRLKFIQRKFSKYNGKRTKHKLVTIYESISNRRRDFLHKLSMQLINNHDSIAIESLNIKGMSSTCKHKQDVNGKYLPNGQSAKSGLNKSILDAGWGMFIDMLEYKSEWYGKNILKIGKFEPSSKMCYGCNEINKSLTLNNREWKCDNCGIFHNRDINAAINIKRFALRDLSVERRPKNRNELPALAGVMTSEAIF